DEKMICVERFTWADHAIPPTETVIGVGIPLLCPETVACAVVRGRPGIPSSMRITREGMAH
ncbi:MAG: hypothetical protein MK239_11225, partial [Gemmatimonadetes bacterium]|nr:hypothetical protein [Gemmatimonadota bacterium]